MFIVNTRVGIADATWNTFVDRVNAATPQASEDDQENEEEVEKENLELGASSALPTAARRRGG